MKQPNVNNQSIVNEPLREQNGQELPAVMLNDLPVNEAQEADVKGGTVTIEYLVLGTILSAPPRPAGTVVSRP